jgi:ATP-binding cassette subfamily F protein uup
VLEQFLDYFAGCLVVASHDRYFLDRTVDFIVAMDAGNLGPRYPSPYATFVRLQHAATANLPGNEQTGARRPVVAATQAAPSERRLTWKERQELTALEERIQAMETRKNSILDEINKTGDNYQYLQLLTAELDELEPALDTALNRWFELSAIAETTGR